MKVYCKHTDFALYEGSMLDMLDVIPLASIDSIVTDPPYELGFMGKSWDASGIAFTPDTWRKCYEVLKPGGHLLAFGGSRTYHRIACAIEDAGFEIRDCIMWLYGSGFPKSMNLGLAIDKRNGVDSAVVGREHCVRAAMLGGLSGSMTSSGSYEIKQAQNEWAGWGTQLKPAYEPVIVARKPCEGSCIDNVLAHRVGGINIDECRIGEGTGEVKAVKYPDIRGDLVCNCHREYQETAPVEYTVIDQGRYPSNVILTYDKTDEREVCGGMPDTKSNGGAYTMPEMGGGTEGVCNFQTVGAKRLTSGATLPADEGSASRYYYCAKASARDRDEGLDAFVKQEGGTYDFRQDGSLDGSVPSRRNTHPTVKPVDLMQYLIRLVTPRGGTILDPFNGSGSTGKAAMFENRDRQANYKYIGIELTPEYLPIAEARITWATEYHDTEKAEKPIEGQLSIFDIMGGQ